MIRGDCGGHKIGLGLARLQCLKSSSETRWTFETIIQIKSLQFNGKCFLIKFSFVCHFIFFCIFLVTMTTSFFLVQILMLATSSIF